MGGRMNAARATVSRRPRAPECPGSRRRSSAMRRSIAPSALALASMAMLTVSTAGITTGCRRRAPAPRELAIVAEPPTDAGPPRKEIDPAALGFALRPDEPTRSANEAVHAGLARHRAGAFAASRALFDEALAASPSYALARFDRACAAARLGDLESAATDLETLLALDLPGFVGRIESDPDLEPLRTSKRGAELRSKREAIRAAWHAAIADAVPAVMWRERDGSALSYKSAKEAAWLRVGAWSPTTHRFLPLAPDVPATNGWFERAVDRAVVVEARINRCQTDSCPNLEHARVSIFDAATSSPVSEATYDARMFGATIAVSAGSVRGDFDDCNEPSCDTGWLRIDGKSWAKDRSPLPQPDVRLGADPWGATLTTMPKGWALDARSGVLTLASGKTLTLDKLHRDGSSTVIVDGDRALVATSHTGCDCEHFPSGEHGLHDHVVSVVEVAAGSAHVWRKGAGIATLGVDPLGGVYLQLDERVERWGSMTAVETEAPRALPDGVLLTAPLAEPDYCCSL